MDHDSKTRGIVRYLTPSGLSGTATGALGLQVAGIDLAGSEKRQTGFSSLDEHLTCRTQILLTNEEIVRETLKLNPAVVSIDAPLFLPKGRKSLDVKGPPHLRACDRELLRMRIRFFPVSLGPMRELTKRGIYLKSVFEERGLKVVESFPGAVQDMLNIPRKQMGLEKLRHALVEYGINGDVSREGISDHELDAVTSALVGKMYVEGDYLAIGEPEEGLMILPKVIPK